MAKQEKKICKMSRPGGVTIPPPTPTESSTVLDLAQWWNREWNIVTRAVATRQDLSYLKLQDLHGYLTSREFEESSADSNCWGNLSPQDIQEKLTAHSRELFEPGGAVLTLI